MHRLTFTALPASPARGAEGFRARGTAAPECTDGNLPLVATDGEGGDV